MNDRGVYIQLFDEETPIFISMTQEELRYFVDRNLEGDLVTSLFLYVKTQEVEKFYSHKNIKEVTIQGG